MSVKGYKAYKKGLICSPNGNKKQYAENTIFEENTAKICSKGMHFCKRPLDVLNYYPLVDESGELSEFTEVEALDECKTDNEEKFCTKKLKVGAKISFAELVKASVNFEMEKGGKAKPNDEDNERIVSKGYSAQIGSSGDYAQIASSGKNSVICCAGINSIAKAQIGSWITLSEWKYSDEEDAYIPICVKTEYVDGERIKADTFYKLIDGIFLEVK